MNAKKIPPIDSIQRLAEFWDSHDLTEFESELEIVDDPVFTRPAEIRISFSREEANELEQIAKRQGVAAPVLVHQWIQEKMSSFEQ